MRETHHVMPLANPSRSGGAARPSQGFTLIEVLVVVAIIALVGAVVVPQMLTAGQLGVQAAARMVISDILYAQNEAVARQSPRKIVFDAAQNRYQVVRMNAGGPDVVLTAKWRTASGATTDQYVTDLTRDSRFQGVRLVNPSFGGEAALVFDELGAPSSGGSVDLLFRNEVRYRVTVAPFTGRVTVAQVPVGG